MEVLNDARFSLVETNDLIVKKMNNLSITTNTILNEESSGSLYLINNLNNNITITLPKISNGVNFEFIFSNTGNNSIMFQTSQNPLDNSQIIGTDWLYLKRTYILIEYSLLSGSKLTFSRTEKGEYIKFFSDGINYYILEKNDTNNNINNISVSYPNIIDNNYLVNINLVNGYYNYNIVNEITNKPITNILMDTNYNFKFNKNSLEYSSLTNITNQQILKLFVYVEYYNNELFTINSETRLYKYPVLNYRLIDSSNNIKKNIDLFNTDYIINLNNDSIKYPANLYSNLVNFKFNNEQIISNNSILNFDFSNDNIIIYNEFDSIIYDHNNDRQFLIFNRDIRYLIKFNDSFKINIMEDEKNVLDNNSPLIVQGDLLKNDIANYIILTLDTPNTIGINYIKITKYRRITNLEGNEITVYNPNTVNPYIDSIDNLNINTVNDKSRIYYLHLEYNTETYIIPILFFDNLYLKSNSNVFFNNTSQNHILNNNSIPNIYNITIESNTVINDNDNLSLSFLKTVNSRISNKYIFNKINSNLKIPIKKAETNDYLLKFMSSLPTTEYFTTQFSDIGNYKIVSLYIPYKVDTSLNISYYSNFNNVTGGNFKLNKFEINDNLSGKIILLNLKNNLNIVLNNNLENNYYELLVNNDNTTDLNTYVLKKIKNSNSVEEYYFTQTNEDSIVTNLKNITLYTNNIYIINVDLSVSELEIRRTENKIYDLFQFSNISDGVLNYKKNISYNFISKQINTTGISYIIDLKNITTENVLYYYNTNIRNIGGLINIVSIEEKLKNISIISEHPFTCEYQYYINNISYEETILGDYTSYILSLKKLKTGDSIKLYFNNNVNIIKEVKFKDNDDNIIDYPKNIISNNNLDFKLIKNNSNYDINLHDDNSNIINNLSTNFRFIKNQEYIISQNDISNYNPENNLVNQYYIKIENNSELNYKYYLDSLFTNEINNIKLYRGLKYEFYQYHRSNHNPDIDIDLNTHFKITLQKNSQGLNVFYINNMEKYTPILLTNTYYYFDLSDVLEYNFDLSIYNDGLLNNNIVNYNTTEVDRSNASIIRLNILNTTILVKLYYFSTNIRNIGGSVDIYNDHINYNIGVKENKINMKVPDKDYFVKKNSPNYELNFKKNGQNRNNLLFYKNDILKNLNFKLYYDSLLKNKIYTTDFLDTQLNETITIYVTETSDTFKLDTPLISYFNFFSNESLSSESKLSLPLTLLQNKKYIFKQILYKRAIFKFFIYIDDYPKNYLDNIEINTTITYDSNIISYNFNENSITLNTPLLCKNYIYFSGIHYSLNNTNKHYTGVRNLLLAPAYNIVDDNQKLLLSQKIFIIPEKKVNLSDNSTTTGLEIITDYNLDFSELLQTDLVNLFNKNKSTFFLKNKSISNIQNISLEIDNIDNKLNNQFTKYIYIPTISSSPIENSDSKYNRNINLIKNTTYNFTITTNYLIQYFKYDYKSPTNLLSLSGLFLTETFNDDDIVDYLIYSDTALESNIGIGTFKATHKILDINIIGTNEVITSTTNKYDIFKIESTTTSKFRILLEHNLEFDEKNIFNYEFAIACESDLSTLKIKYINTSNKYDLISLNKKDIFTNTTDELIVDNITSDKITYVDLVFRKNIQEFSEDNTVKFIHNPKNTENIYICTLKIVKDTLTKKIVNYGKIIINDFNILENKNTDTFLSKSVKYELSDNDNSIPNNDLINTYYLDLIDTEFKSNETNIENGYKRLVINTDLFNKNDTDIFYKNIVSTNLYISDFRTIVIDTSSLNFRNNNTNIIFYTDENATNKLDSNILYKKNKIILNINPAIYPLLYYYSDCIYESKIKNSFTIKSNLIVNNVFFNELKETTKNKIIVDNLFDLNIIPFLENSKDINYNIQSNRININLDKSYFILYNDTYTYRGTIICDRIFIPSTGESKSLLPLYFYSIKLQFDDSFKLYSNINITSDYKLKIFRFKGGKIFTPNYLHLDVINNKNLIDIGSSNNIIFHNNSDKYLVNNKIISGIGTFSYDSNDRFYITHNPCERFQISGIGTIGIGTILQNNYDSISYNGSSVFNLKLIDNNNNSNFKNRYYTDNIFNLNNTLSLNTTTEHLENTINTFNILVKLIKTTGIRYKYNDNMSYEATVAADQVQNYYTIKMNVNSVDDSILVLKPYQSYIFNIVNYTDFLLNINKISENDRSTENTFYKIIEPELTIVNTDDTKILDTVVNINESASKIKVYIPYDSELYNEKNKLYLKFSCKICDETNETVKIKQKYFNRNQTLSSINGTETFTDYVPVIIDKKSVIVHKVTYFNSNYLINKIKNYINFYTFYTHIFDYSELPSNINFDINIGSSNNILKKNSEKQILIYLKNNINNNSDFNSIDLIEGQIKYKINYSELKPNYDSNEIIFLNKKYRGNDSSNDFVDSVKHDYIVNYSGEPGYNGKLIFNYNSIKDFNINTNNINQNSLFVNFNTYINNSYNYSYFNNIFFDTNILELYEPVKLKIDYFNTTIENYIELTDYNYSNSFFPGKQNSNLNIKIPKDIDSDNLFNENIKLYCVGIYTNNIISNINPLILKSDIYNLPQHNSSIFINVTNNIIIRLPIPNYSLEYKFIVVNSTKDYTITFLTFNNIYGYIDESLHKNIELKYNKELIFKNISNGNSFTLVSNNGNYYLENISIKRQSIDNISTIQYNKNIIYVPNKNIFNIDLDIGIESFSLKSNFNKTDTANNILYNDILYNFNTIELNDSDYFELYDLNLINPSKIDLSTNILLNNYNNLNYVLKINKILMNQDFNTYIGNKNTIKYTVTYYKNEVTDTYNILFNNSTNIPTLYNNYIYEFNKFKGFFIVNNNDLNNVKKTNTIDYNNNVTIINNDLITKLRINDIIKYPEVSSTISIGTVYLSNNEDNTLKIESSFNSFKNLPIGTEIYFNDTIYHSKDNSIINKIIEPNTIYKLAKNSGSDSKIILENIHFKNTNSSFIKKNEDSAASTLINDVYAYILRNSYNYNTHKINYIYYFPIIIDETNNILEIEINSEPKSIIIDKNEYTFDCINGQITNSIINTINDKFVIENLSEFTIGIGTYGDININTSENVRNKFILENNRNSFKLLETNLSILLGLNTITNSIRIGLNNYLYLDIPQKIGFFNTDDYYNYYGNKINIQYNTLTYEESNSIISIDLETDKHIFLPIIKDGLIYTFTINNSSKNKKLYIYSYSDLYITYEQLVSNGNILCIKPNINTQLYIGTTIQIYSNNNKYFIGDIKGKDFTKQFHNIRFYNNKNNFSKLYLLDNGYNKIDKYISIFNIHIIGEKTLNNEDELKFLHVVKVLAYILDPTQTKTIYDNNILNTLVHKNSYILLCNELPDNYLDNTKHLNHILIKYSDININYNYEEKISLTNKFDITLEKIIELISYSYIHTYNHIFSYKNLINNSLTNHSLNNLDIYKYIDNTPINIQSNMIQDNRNTKSSFSINNKYFITKDSIKNINDCIGKNISLKITNFNLVYQSGTEPSIEGVINIINIGSGYKNKDQISINLTTNLNILITLTTLELNSNTELYNVFNAYTELQNQKINTYTISQLVNTESYNTHLKINGEIVKNTNHVISNKFETVADVYNHNIHFNELIYNKTLDNDNDTINYIKTLLLATLDYYKLRLIKNEPLTHLEHSLLNYTLVEKYNPKFISLYYTSSLHLININNINNINTNNIYDLNNLDYIKSDNNNLNNITTTNLVTEINFENVIKTYSSEFNNSVQLNITNDNQFSQINTRAELTKNNKSIVIPLNVIDSTTVTPIIDTSIIDNKTNYYYESYVKILIDITSESNIANQYIINLLRKEDTISSNNEISEISVSYSDNNMYKINSSDEILYYPMNTTFSLKIILTNIYSSIEEIQFNNNSIKVDNLSSNNYFYNYSITTNNIKSNLYLKIKSEANTERIYNIKMMKEPSSIALLDNVIISNVININPFYTYNFNYNGIISESSYNNLTDNIGIGTTTTGVSSTSTELKEINDIEIVIKKKNVYSSVNTTIEFLDTQYDLQNLDSVGIGTGSVDLSETNLYNNINSLRKHKYIMFKNTVNEKINVFSYKNSSEILNENYEHFITHLVKKYKNDVNQEYFTFKNFRTSNNIINNTNNSVIIRKYSNEYESSSTDTTQILQDIYLPNYKLITIEEHFNRIELNSSPIDNDIEEIAHNTLGLEMKSRIYKNTGDSNVKVLNIASMPHIKININVISEDKKNKNTYTYIINLNRYKVF